MNIIEGDGCDVLKLGAGYVAVKKGKILKKFTSEENRQAIEYAKRINNDIDLPSLDNTLFMIDINKLKLEMMKDENI